MKHALRKDAKVTVKVPGSTSNLGPGFDALGCALAIHNVFTWEVAPAGRVEVSVTGSEGAGIALDRDNLAVATALDFLEGLGVEDAGLALRATIAVPQARGLGSSSTAIVGGLVGANAMLRHPLPDEEVLAEAIRIEGHPDNVAPALLGGLVACATESVPPVWRRYGVSRKVTFVVAIPEYEVRTKDARAVLPRQLSIADAIFNLSRTALLVDALRSGDMEGLDAMMQDRLHQPYRKPLYRAFDRFREAALRAGAAGFCVSGAGPAMLAVAPTGAGGKVRAALERAFRSTGVPGRTVELRPEMRGALRSIRVHN